MLKCTFKVSTIFYNHIISDSRFPDHHCIVEMQHHCLEVLDQGIFGLVDFKNQDWVRGNGGWQAIITHMLSCLAGVGKDTVDLATAVDAWEAGDAESRVSSSKYRKKRNDLDVYNSWNRLKDQQIEWSWRSGFLKLLIGNVHFIPFKQSRWWSQWTEKIRKNQTFVWSNQSRLQSNNLNSMWC